MRLMSLRCYIHGCWWCEFPCDLHASLPTGLTKTILCLLAGLIRLFEYLIAPIYFPRVFSLSVNFQESIGTPDVNNKNVAGKIAARPDTPTFRGSGKCIVAPCIGGGGGDSCHCCTFHPSGDGGHGTVEPVEEKTQIIQLIALLHWGKRNFRLGGEVKSHGLCIIICNQNMTPLKAKCDQTAE